jgi:cyclic pyranopterin monophosphate synthase
MADESFSHVDASGRLQMVDVSDKVPSRRTAQAECLIVTSVDVAGLDARTLGLDHIQTARLAGIQAAKLTAQLVPLCHPIGLDHIHVDVLAHERGFTVRSTVSTIARTGVEMEALCACAFGALSLLDSIIPHDRTARASGLEVLSKTGGKSDWGREADSPRRVT